MSEEECFSQENNFCLVSQVFLHNTQETLVVETRSIIWLSRSQRIRWDDDLRKEEWVTHSSFTFFRRKKRWKASSLLKQETYKVHLETGVPWLFFWDQACFVKERKSYGWREGGGGEKKEESLGASSLLEGKKSKDPGLFMLIRILEWVCVYYLLSHSPSLMDTSRPDLVFLARNRKLFLINSKLFCLPIYLRLSVS